MSTYALIPGAGCSPFYWHLLELELRGRGHDVLPIDLPNEDDAAGLAEYADLVARAIGDRDDEVIVVAHSFGGFTAPLVCSRVRVDLLVLVSAMIPRPGEAPGDWWTNTGYASEEQDDVYYHDVDPALAAAVEATERDQSGTPLAAPWPLDAWPDVPTRVLLFGDDRVFPAAFMRRVAAERLGIEPDEMPGGHMAMLSRPDELAERLEAYRAAVGSGA
jgi:pimeloyl-ACP methyl ester carboxylesterase